MPKGNNEHILQLPMAVALAPVPDGAKILYAYIGSICVRAADGRAHVKQADMARALGRSQRTISFWIHALREANLVQMDRHPFDTGHYTITKPEE